MGKSKSGFPNPVFHFFFWGGGGEEGGVQGGKSKNGSRIHKIHTQGGFCGSNPDLDFCDTQSKRFFGKGFQRSIFDLM